MTRIHACAVLCWVVLFGAPVTTGAQESATTSDARTYGTASKTFVALPPWAFVPQDSAISYQSQNDVGIGWTLSRTSTGTSFFRAPLNLPSGASVTELEAVFCDTSTSNSLILQLLIQPRMGSPTNVLGPRSTNAETPGCVDRTVALDPPVRIDNSSFSYSLFVTINATDTTIKLASARVGYVLDVRPPPAAATFNDVPTNHPFFPFIEALVASGITTGCSVSPPLYCPDDFVTRKQIAAFFAKALGLHWAP